MANRLRMLTKWSAATYGWRRGETVAHCTSGKRFQVVGFAPGGNAARDRLALRPLLKGGRKGKRVVRVSTTICRAGR